MSSLYYSGTSGMSEKGYCVFERHTHLLALFVHALPSTTRIGDIPLLFKEGEKTHPKNYKPLSLLCID
jgi:hypothetical protein